MARWGVGSRSRTSTANVANSGRPRVINHSQARTCPSLSRNHAATVAPLSFASGVVPSASPPARYSTPKPIVEPSRTCDFCIGQVDHFGALVCRDGGGIRCRREELNSMRIRDSVAVVTGASSGIGAATAHALAERGATVIAVARRKDRLDETIEHCRRFTSASMARPGDVADRAFAEDVIRDAHEHFGRVDILVNNAGISPGEKVTERAVDDAREIMAVNFFGAVHFAGAALPGMLERGAGSIVNVTSVSGYVPAPGEPAYGASTAALSRWSHGLLPDVHGTGVHVGVLSPGPID